MFKKPIDEKKKALDPDVYFELAKNDLLGNQTAFLDSLINFDKDNKRVKDLDPYEGDYIVEIKGGEHHSIARILEGAAYCWGRNDEG